MGGGVGGEMNPALLGRRGCGGKRLCGEQLREGHQDL